MIIPLFFFAALCYFINRQILTSSIWILGVKILVYTIIFAIITYFGSFNAYEKGLIKGLFRKSGPKRTNEKCNSNI